MEAYEPTLAQATFINSVDRLRVSSSIELHDIGKKRQQRHDWQTEHIYKQRVLQLENDWDSKLEQLMRRENLNQRNTQNNSVNINSLTNKWHDMLKATRQMMRKYNPSKKKKSFNLIAYILNTRVI